MDSQQKQVLQDVSQLSQCWDPGRGCQDTWKGLLTKQSPLDIHRVGPRTLCRSTDNQECHRWHYCATGCWPRANDTSWICCFSLCYSQHALHWHSCFLSSLSNSSTELVHPSDYAVWYTCQRSEVVFFLCLNSCHCRYIVKTCYVLLCFVFYFSLINRFDFQSKKNVKSWKWKKKKKKMTRFNWTFDCWVKCVCE